MKGADVLSRIRLARMKPDGYVTLWLDESFGPAPEDVTFTMSVERKDSVALIDLRCLLELCVNVVAMRPESAERLDLLVSRLEGLPVARMHVERHWLHHTEPNFLVICEREEMTA